MPSSMRGASGVHDAIHAASGPCAARPAPRMRPQRQQVPQHVLGRVVARARVERLRLPRGQRVPVEEAARRSAPAAASGARRGRRTTRRRAAAAPAPAAPDRRADPAPPDRRATATRTVPRGSCTAIHGNCRQAIGLASAPPHACRPQPHGPAVWNTQRPARRPSTDRRRPAAQGDRPVPTPSRGRRSPAVRWPAPAARAGRPRPESPSRSNSRRRCGGRRSAAWAMSPRAGSPVGRSEVGTHRGLGRVDVRAAEQDGVDQQRIDLPQPRPRLPAGARAASVPRRPPPRAARARRRARASPGRLRGGRRRPPDRSAPAGRGCR